jgi:hypothetical protein
LIEEVAGVPVYVLVWFAYGMGIFVGWLIWSGS